MEVRAKFQCFSVKRYASNVWDSTHKAMVGNGYLYEYEFQPVTGGSPENDQFFASTPGGSLKLTAVRDNLFEPGKSYYLDFSVSES